MAPSNQEKLKQEMLSSLRQEVQKVKKKLDGQVQLTERQVGQYVKELEQALRDYKQANASLLATLSLIHI